MSKIYDELRPVEGSRDGVSVISANLRIKGEISGNEDMLVEGTIEGPIRLESGMLTVGATGKITADVVAREIVIYGAIKGNVTARDRIEIKQEGSMMGDVTTARIIIEDGAKLKGSVEIVGREPSSDS